MTGGSTVFVSMKYEGKVRSLNYLRVHTNNSSSVLAEQVDSKHHNALRAGENIINESLEIKFPGKKWEGV